jgi:hypothetical protein
MSGVMYNALCSVMSVGVKTSKQGPIKNATNDVKKSLLG